MQTGQNIRFLFPPKACLQTIAIKAAENAIIVYGTDAGIKRASKSPDISGDSSPQSNLIFLAAQQIYSAVTLVSTDTAVTITARSP